MNTSFVLDVRAQTQYFQRRIVCSFSDVRRWVLFSSYPPPCLAHWYFTRNSIWNCESVILSGRSLVLFKLLLTSWRNLFCHHVILYWIIYIFANIFVNFCSVDLEDQLHQSRLVLSLVLAVEMLGHELIVFSIYVGWRNEGWVLKWICLCISYFVFWVKCSDWILLFHQYYRVQNSNSTVW